MDKGVLISNFDELVKMRKGLLSRLRYHALRAVEAAIKSVTPRNSLRRNIRRRGSKLIIMHRKRIDLKRFERILVLGAGKASIGMAEYIEEILGDFISGGAVVAPKELAERSKLEKIEVLPSTHPIPSELGVKAALNILEYAGEVGENTLTIFLLSGGASALLPMPAHPLTLQDKIEFTKLLLASGANMDEINAVRKHLSGIKGGLLGKKLSKGFVISLIISDVVGDKLETIGSGPTAPDPTTFKDAYEILKRYGLWDKIPEAARSRIKLGLDGKVEETPKPGDPIFKRIVNLIVAGVGDACKAAESYLRSKGYRSTILTRFMEGEAKEIGVFSAGLLRQLSERRGRYAMIMGGETTVTVKGRGIGGRNQELALSASLKLRDLKDCCLVSVGTDGVDGPTDAAGAMVDGETYWDALRLGLNPVEFLAENDSNTFFKRVGGLIITGYTGTNVGDVVLLLKADR